MEDWVRKEKDSLGELEIPDGVYYGIQAFRASQNFPISGTQVHPELLKTFLLLKRSAARAKQEVGARDPLRGVGSV
jgi:aspartate ammonia-lyase